MGEHRNLSDKDIEEITGQRFTKDKEKWDGVERRKAISSTVEPYHEKRRPEKK